MKEKVLYVNSNDEVIGADTRENITSKKFTRRIVRVIFVDRDDKLLIQKRSSTKNIFPLTYDQSVGGHVAEGEDYLNAAIRESREELGIDIKEKDLKEIGHFYCEEIYDGVIYREFNKLYVCRYKGEKLKFSKEEITEVSWKTIDEIDNIFLNDVNLLAGGFRVSWVYIKKYFGEKN